MTGADRQRGDLSDLQRRGVETAMEAFERIVQELDAFDGRRPRIEPDAGSLDGSGTPGDLPQLRAAIARTIDVYADLFRQTLELYADVVDDALRRDAPAAPEAAGTGAEIELVGAPGGEAVAAVWIHNSASTPVDVALRMTDLTAHDGTRIEAAAASFAPAHLGVPPGASRSTWLSVRVPRSAAPGTYVGHVLATGLPGTRLAVALLVPP